MRISNIKRNTKTQRHKEPQENLSSFIEQSSTSQYDSRPSTRQCITSHSVTNYLSWVVSRIVICVAKRTKMSCRDNLCVFESLCFNHLFNPLRTFALFALFAFFLSYAEADLLPIVQHSFFLLKIFTFTMMSN